MGPASVDGSNYETSCISDAVNVQKAAVEVPDVDVTHSNTVTRTSDRRMSSSLDAVQLRGAAECQQNSARSGKVMTRKMRRLSLTARQHPDKLCTRTRRRHSFMLPNGADVYPSRRLSVGFAWPTIVEEEAHLAAEAERSARKLPNKCEAAVTTDLRQFRATFKTFSDVDSGKLNQDPPRKDGVFVSFDADSNSADFRSPRSGGLQTACGESGQTDTEIILEDRGDLVSDVLGMGPGKTTACADAGNPSPSPPVARDPPSYDEALLHQAMRRRCANFIESEMAMTHQRSSFRPATTDNGEL